VPQSERADYLGRALAITSVMLLVGGADGFADHFEGALDGVGLAASWSTVKPYLGDIAAKVSVSASSATFAILQTLAQRFPQDSTFVTGFTADRVDSMVDVLQEKGFSNNVIQSDIGQVAQVASSSSDEAGAGDEADILSLQQGGGIQASVEPDRTLVRYDDGSGDTVTLNGEFLQQVLPGFDPRGPEFVAIHYQEAGVTVYHYYPVKNIPVGALLTMRETRVGTPLCPAMSPSLAKQSLFLSPFSLRRNLCRASPQLLIPILRGRVGLQIFLRLRDFNSQEPRLP